MVFGSEELLLSDETAGNPWQGTDVRTSTSKGKGNGYVAMLN
jgi:hypothetical protein